MYWNILCKKSNSLSLSPSFVWKTTYIKPSVTRQSGKIGWYFNLFQSLLEYGKHMNTKLFEDRISNGRSMFLTGNVLDQGFKYQTSTHENKMASICLGFTWHSKTRPFGIRPLFDHLNTKLVCYLDPHCTSRNYCVDLNNYHSNKWSGKQMVPTNFWWNLKRTSLPLRRLNGWICTSNIND